MSYPGVTRDVTTNSLMTPNPMKRWDIPGAPELSVSALAFSPPSLPEHYLVGGTYDGKATCWGADRGGDNMVLGIGSVSGAIHDMCWIDDGSKVFVAGSDGKATIWDLNTHHSFQVGQHKAAVTTCHWIRAPTYSCLMTGSLDKTLKFWDTRQAQPMKTMVLTDQCVAADLVFPMAAVATADRGMTIFNVMGDPQEVKRLDNVIPGRPTCVAIYKDMMSNPAGFATGDHEGRITIFDVAKPNDPDVNYTIMCHRQNSTGGPPTREVNGVVFHPVHGTFATVGSDGCFAYWDRHRCVQLMQSEEMEQSITRCAISHDGEIFAYAVGHDWSKGADHFDASKKTAIFFRVCSDEMKPPGSSYSPSIKRARDPSVESPGGHSSTKHSRFQ